MWLTRMRARMGVLACTARIRFGWQARTCSGDAQLVHPRSPAPRARFPPPPPPPPEQEQEECIRETQILSEFDCDYIIKYWDSFLEKARARRRPPLPFKSVA